MHVNIGCCGFYCACYVDVIVAIKIGVNTTLQRDLGGAKCVTFAHALGNVVKRQQIWRATQVEAERALGKPAELAFERAHVGVVDVAVVHPSDVVAHSGAAQFVGGKGNSPHFGPASAEQRNNFLFAEFIAKFNTAQYFAHWAVQLA